MEVTVLDVTNPPSKPVLAIHAGSVRRQAKLEVNQPFVIPHPGSQTGPVEVSLFQQLASHVLPSDNTPEVFCNIPVKKLDGQASQVQLRVRRGEAANAGKQQKSADDSMGLTRDYLDQHQLQQRIQSLIQDVLREQPDNPYKYMLQQLRKAKGGSEAEKQDIAPGPGRTPAQPEPAPREEAKPLVPRPPEQPKPDVPRGRPQTKPVEAQVTNTEDAEDDDVVGAITSKYGSEAFVSEAQIAATFSVKNLLRMPKCRSAAEQSLRNLARTTTAKSMSGLVITSIKEKLTAECERLAMPPKEEDARSLVRASIDVAMEGAATLLSPEYARAISTWARCVAYRGAGQILGREEGEERRISMPTPIVFLEGGSSSWGSWLSSGAPKAS